MGPDLRRRREVPVRITTAPTSRAADIATRQRRYLLSMAVRSLCFAGAIVAALAGLRWLWPMLMVGAVLLPYVAVVLANGVGSRSDGTDLVDVGFRSHELGPGSDPGPDSGAAAGPDLGPTTGPDVL